MVCLENKLLRSLVNLTSSLQTRKVEYWMLKIEKMQCMDFRYKENRSYYLAGCDIEEESNCIAPVYKDVVKLRIKEIKVHKYFVVSLEFPNMKIS